MWPLARCVSLIDLKCLIITIVQVDEDDRDFRRSRRGGGGGGPDSRRGDLGDMRMFRRRMDDEPSDITRRLGPRQRPRFYEEIHRCDFRQQMYVVCICVDQFLYCSFSYKFVVSYSRMKFYRMV